jgi:hypothetical protein
MMLLLKGSRSASEQRFAYMDRCTKAVTKQASDEQPQDAISIGEIRSPGELQLLSSVMVTSGTLIKTRALRTSHRNRKQDAMQAVNANDQCLACVNTREARAHATD